MRIMSVYKHVSLILILLVRFESLQVEVRIYHGGKLVSKRAYSPLAKITKSFFCSVVWDKW